MFPPIIWIQNPITGLLRRFDAVGIGRYPYPCGAADKWPKAMVYRSESPHHCTWLHSAEALYRERRADLDGVRNLLPDLVEA